MSTLRNSLTRPLGLVVIGLIVCLGAGTLMSSSNQATGDPGIRFVDVHGAMVKSKFFLEKMKLIQKDLENTQNQLKSLAEEFKKKGTLLENLQRGSDKAQEIAMEMALIKNKVEYIKKAVKSKSIRNEKTLECTVYDQIRQKIASYAKANNLTAVYLVDEARNELLKKKSTRLELIVDANSLRGVLWHNPALDITQNIVQMMNN